MGGHTLRDESQRAEYPSLGEVLRQFPHLHPKNCSRSLAGRHYCREFESHRELIGELKINPDIIINGLWVLWFGLVMVYWEKINKIMDEEGLWPIVTIAGYFVAFIGFWLAFSGIVATAV